MKDPAGFQPPGGDRTLVGLRVEELRGSVPFAPLDNLPLDLGQSPVVEALVSELPDKCMVGSAHTVNCPIASNTDWLS